MNNHENHNGNVLTFGMLDAQRKAQAAASTGHALFSVQEDIPMTSPAFEAVEEQVGHEQNLADTSPLDIAPSDHDVNLPSDTDPIDLIGETSTSTTMTPAVEPEPRESFGEVLANASENIGAPRRKVDMVQEFVSLARTLEYAKDPLANLYATIKDEAFTDIVPVKSKAFLGFVRDRIYEITGNFLTEKDFRAGQEQVVYHAEKKSPPEKGTINRVLTDESHIYLDMRTTPPSFLKYDLHTGDQEYVPTAPFLPLRFPGQKSLPKPIRHADGKAFDEFFHMLNVGDVHDQALIKSFLVARMAYGELITPCLVFLGNQATGKTTLSKLIKNIIDPTNAPSHMPTKLEDLKLLLAHQFMPVLDNVSNISSEFSDQLCTAVTGIECGKRALYKDDEMHLMYLKTSAIITSIKIPHFKDDLASRIFFIRRPPLAGGHTSLSLIEKKFTAMHPYLLDELLQISREVRKYDFSEHLITTERNVDFTGVMSLVCQHVYGDTDLARKIVDRNNHYRGIEALNGNVAVAAILLFMSDKRGWKGTLTELIAAIKENGSHTPDFPEAANAFSRMMNKGMSTLEGNGIIIRKQANGPNGTPYMLINTNIAA